MGASGFEWGGRGAGARVCKWASAPGSTHRADRRAQRGGERLDVVDGLRRLVWRVADGRDAFRRRRRRKPERRDLVAQVGEATRV